MTKKRTIIIGDIHGMLTEMQALISKVNYQPEKDSLILVGDLVDRGPDSIGAIEHAMHLNAHLVIGNHDDKYIRYRKHERKKQHVGRKHYRNPMVFNEKKLKIWHQMSDSHIDYLESGVYCFPLWEYNAFVVHAGVLPDSLPYHQNKEVYLYARYIDKDNYKLLSLPKDFSRPKNSIHWSEVYNASYDIFYGHDVQSFDEPVIKHNSAGGRAIGIDTGACFGGHLTAAILEPNNNSIQFVKQRANKTWQDYKIVR